MGFFCFMDFEGIWCFVRVFDGYWGFLRGFMVFSICFPDFPWFYLGVCLTKLTYLFGGCPKAPIGWLVYSKYLNWM